MKFSLLIFVSALILSYQNCSKVEFMELPVVDKNPKGLGDPKDPLPPEIVIDLECKEGKVLGIWLDPDQSGVLKDENFKGSIVSYSGNDSGAENYNFYSDSAHPIIGPSPFGYEAQIFFFDGSDGLSLNFYANIDKGGSSDNEMNVDIEVLNNNLADKMILSDDEGEFKQISQEETSSSYEGRFHYWTNTDGGVLGPLVGENFKLQFKFNATGDVNTANFYSAGGGSISLSENSGSDISSFVIAYKSYQICNE